MSSNQLQSDTLTEKLQEALEFQEIEYNPDNWEINQTNLKTTNTELIRKIANIDDNFEKSLLPNGYHFEYKKGIHAKFIESNSDFI